jgi:16S rRNA (cytosine967-C5)-methyltransferase
VQEFGPIAAKKICEYDQATPTTSIRLRSPRAEEELIRQGMVLDPGSLLSLSRTVRAGDISKSAALQNGLVAIQDEASQLVAALVRTGTSTRNPGILDCCAAPGGKTFAIADRNPTTTIAAFEIHPHRARLMKGLLQRYDGLGARVQVIAADARRSPVLINFDRVLADAPCSGTGTLCRNPEIKWRLQADSFADLSHKQVEILQSALQRVAPGGRIVYSTCSLEREENEQVVERVLDQNKSFRVLDCRLELEHLKAEGELIWENTDSLVRGPFLRTVPGVHPCDGFFAAILERT